MRIITSSCPECGTIVAANVLETNREMKCPRLDCQELLQFSDLSEADRENILKNIDDYHI